MRHILIGEFAVSRTIVIGKGVHLALRASDARDIIIIGGGGGGCGGGSSIVSSIHAESTLGPLKRLRFFTDIQLQNLRSMSQLATLTTTPKLFACKSDTEKRPC